MRTEICHKRKVFIPGLKCHDHDNRRLFDIETPLMEGNTSVCRKPTLTAPASGRGEKKCAEEEEKNVTGKMAMSIHGHQFNNCEGRHVSIPAFR